MGGRRKSFRLNETNIPLIKNLYSAGMSYERIARDALGIQLTELNEHLNKNVAVRRLVESARSNADGKLLITAFQRATEPLTLWKEVRGNKEYYQIPPDPNLLKFLIQTKLGWRTTDQVEHSGPGGKPIQHQLHAIVEKKMPTLEEVEIEMKRLEKFLKAPDGQS